MGLLKELQAIEQGDFYLGYWRPASRKKPIEVVLYLSDVTNAKYIPFCIHLNDSALSAEQIEEVKRIKAYLVRTWDYEFWLKLDKIINTFQVLTDEQKSEFMLHYELDDLNLQYL